MDDEGEGLSGVVLNPPLPLGRGELRVREVVQAEPAAPLHVLGVQLLLGFTHLININQSIDEEVHGCRIIAQGPRGWAGEEGGVEDFAELKGVSEQMQDQTSKFVGAEGRWGPLPHMPQALHSPWVPGQCGAQPWTHSAPCGSAPRPP